MDWGYDVKVCEMLDGVFYFKMVCFILGDGVILVIKVMVDNGFFGDCKIVVVLEGEEYVVNVIWVNDVVLVFEGYLRILVVIDVVGFKMVVLLIYEVWKVDGGLSCLLFCFNL